MAECKSLMEKQNPKVLKIKMENCGNNDSLQEISPANMEFSTEVKVEKFDDYIKEEEEYGDNDYYVLTPPEIVKLDPQDTEDLPKIIKTASIFKKSENIKNIANFENIIPDNCAGNKSVKTLNTKNIKLICNDILTNTLDKANKHANKQNNIEDVQNEMKKTIEDIDNEIKQETLEYEELLSNIFQESNNIRIVSNRTEKPIIKIEPIDEEIFENDLIQLDHTYADVNTPKQDSIDLTDDEISVDYHEEIYTHKNDTCIDKTTIQIQMRCKKPKVYHCNKCGYKNYHKQFKEHKQLQCKPTRKYEHKEKKIVPHMCSKCGLVFDSLKRYLIHFKIHQYTSLTCPHCLVIFKDSYKLTRHVNTLIRQNFVRLRLIDQNIVNTSKKSKKAYECKQCKVIVERDNFFTHWETHLEIKNVVQAIVRSENETVDIDGDNQEVLRPHLLKDILQFLQTPDRVLCLKPCCVCHRNFKRKNESKRHVIEHLLLDASGKREACHSSMLRCQICQEEFKTNDKYKRHMREHGSLPIYRCELCDHTFSDSSNFAKHKKIHNLQVMFCDICKKKFLAKPSLIKHIEMHNNTRPITCQHCPNTIFYTQSAYKRHYRNHHLKTIIPVKCTMCVKKFNTVKEKWDHMWEVHKERKDIADCPVCKKSFRKFQDVKTHMMSVHNLKAKIINMKTIKSVVAKRNSKLRMKKNQFEYPFSTKELSGEPHSRKEQLVKPHTKKEPSLNPHSNAVKLHSPKTQLIKSPSTKKQSIKPHSTKEQSVKSDLTKKQSIKPHSTKEQSVKSDSTKKQSIKPHSTKEQSLKKESTKEQSLKKQSTEEYSVKRESIEEHSVKKESIEEQSVKKESIEQSEKLNSTEEQVIIDIPQAVTKTQPVKETFTKLFSVNDHSIARLAKEHSRNDQLPDPHSTNDQLENWYTVVKIGKKYSNDLLLKHQTPKVIHGKIIKSYPTNDPLTKARSIRDQLIKKQLIKPQSAKAQYVKQLSVMEHTKTKQSVVPTSKTIKLIKPLTPKLKNPKLQLIEDQLLKETSIKRQLIKSGSGQYRLIVLNRIRK